MTVKDILIRPLEIKLLCTITTAAPKAENKLTSERVNFDLVSILMLQYDSAKGKDNPSNDKQVEEKAWEKVIFKMNTTFNRF